MATERQIEANRRNAGLSTGPKSAEGKARSRANATRHGLAGESAEVVEAANSPAFEARRAAWAEEFRPSGDPARWALDRAVAASLRIEGCERAIEGLARSAAERARLCWDQDREVEAARLAAGLARAPHLVARQLASTDQGALLLIGTWERLDAALDEEGGWTEAECSKALDLLAVHADFRSGWTPIDDPAGGDARAFRRAIVDREIARLDDLREKGLIELDEFAREQALSGDLALIGQEARRVLRYERDAWRRYRESIHELKAPEPASPAPVAPVAPSRPAPSRPEPSARPSISPSEMAELLRRYEREDLDLDDLRRVPGAELPSPLGAEPGRNRCGAALAASGR